jgi:hypothetical protein
MVMIKGGILTGAVGLAAWRVGRPIDRRSTVAYVVAVAVSGFAVGGLWSLSFLGLGSGLFWLGLLVAGWGVSQDRAMLRGWPVGRPEATPDSGSVGSGVGAALDRPAPEHPEPLSHQDQPEQEQAGQGSFSGAGEPQRNGHEEDESDRTSQTDHQRRHSGAESVPAGVASGGVGEE